MNKRGNRAGRLRGVLFDKDGTLFDFQASWSAWAMRLLGRLGRGDPGRVAAMADAIGFDLRQGAFLPGSLVIAGTSDEVTRALHPHVAGISFSDLQSGIDDEATRVPLVEVVPLRPLLAHLRMRDFRLGVATNDAEVPARTHLHKAGVIDLFDCILGSDSGYGGKPAPGQLLAFAAATDLPPDAIAMVGDSLHDLHAARAAGMVAVGVLSGPASAEDLAGAADVVLPDIGHLPGWLKD